MKPASLFYSCPSLKQGGIIKNLNILFHDIKAGSFCFLGSCCPKGYICSNLFHNKWLKSNTHYDVYRKTADITGFALCLKPSGKIWLKSDVIMDVESEQLYNIMQSVDRFSMKITGG